MQERTRWGRVDPTGKITPISKPTTMEMLTDPDNYVSQLIRIYDWKVPITCASPPSEARCIHRVGVKRNCPLCRRENHG
jgi:hypothetical protein